MALILRDREELKIKANFHWSSYLAWGVWAFFGTLILLGSLVTESSFGSFLTILFIFWGPLLYTKLANRCKDYSITNQRLYVENGIISKNKTDIPLQKINDIAVSQGIIQRLLGSGNISVLTGNDKRTKLTNIDNPEIFKNKLSELTEQAIYEHTHTKKR